MTPKKIMLFTDWYEPAFKAGGPIRSCVNFAAHMKEDHDIYIFTGDRDLGDEHAYPQVETNRWIKRNGVQVCYASPGALNWENILVQVQDIKPDYIYLNNMYSRYFTIYPLLMKRLGFIKAKVVLAPRGMLQQGAIQFKSGKKKTFLAALNFLGVSKYIHAHATDEQEKKDIYTYLPSVNNVTVIPNFSPAAQPELTYLKKNKGEIRAVFISRVAPKKNILFFLSLLFQLPAATQLDFTIRGAVEDEQYWQQCIDAAKALPENISVQYEGPVNNNEVTTVIQQHHLFVLPTLGENFGHAIFEALSAGRPVLISDQTPWRNLQEQHAGWDLPLTDEKAFVQVLQEVADMDDEAYQQWSAGAWQYAKNFTESANLKEKYKELFS
ncbi:glycosyltransferase family 4 protein [Agriterribacter sp.]|uniref:glycosyltransferase family 4 protein n=1 Tax=Agriterribacter sp. TaxID=2821509 RepID=UPI002BA40929|nr:glycosyltransferase family 4 protein [Agriterribacter sp.]HRP57664.1 glycosyltransferase family 4 protein [Agriterribacter sp.]